MKVKEILKWKRNLVVKVPYLQNNVDRHSENFMFYLTKTVMLHLIQSEEETKLYIRL